MAKGLLAGASASPQDLQAAIDRDLQPRSQPLAGAQATLHLENSVRSRSLSYNVVGLLPGSAPDLAAETIIVSAHHDHNGTSGADIWHGADDNGSGTVGVVEKPAGRLSGDPCRLGSAGRREVVVSGLTAFGQPGA